MKGLAFLRESTLVGQHCKGRQQIIIETTKHKVWGNRQMALLAYRLKWACYHKAWEVQKTSKGDAQTNPFLTSQGGRTVGPRLALQLLSPAYSV